MMNVTISIDDFSVTSRGQEIAVSPGDFSPEIWARLAIHGAVQKIADAASNAAKIAAENGSDISAETLAMMGKAYDSLCAGNWATRTAGLGVDLITNVRRSIARKALKIAWGAKSPKFVNFTGLSDEMQNEKLDKLYADNSARFDPQVRDEIDRREAMKAAKKDLTGGISIDI